MMTNEHEPLLVLSRRRALGAIVAGTGAVLLAACGPGPPAAAPTPTTVPATQPLASTPAAGVTSATAAQPLASAPAAATTAAAAAPAANPTAQRRPGGMLRSGVVGDPPSLEGHLFAGNNFETVNLVFDQLTNYDTNFVPQPMLAESWDVGADYKQIKLNLRKGVQWHSGRDFTSDDVKYNIMRAQDPKVGAGQFANQARWFTSIDTPDKYTAILNSDQPRPLVFDFFEYFNIVDKDTVDGPNAKTTTVGTGPFTFVEWIPGDHLTFNKNPNYWQTGRPYVDNLRMAITKDAQAMVAQLEGGTVDMARSPALIDYNRLKSDAAYQAVNHPNPGTYFVLAFNTLNPPFDNKNVRQAFNYAFDRQRFVDTATYGAAIPYSLMWLPGSPAYEASRSNAYPFDLEKARSILEAAGVTQLEMAWLLTTSTEGNIASQMYQADLATLGVKMNIQVLETAAWLDQVNNRKYVGGYWSPASYGQLSPGTTFGGTKAWDPFNNNEGFKSDTYAQLVAAAGTEVDPVKQKQIYSQLNDLVLDESFVVVVASSPQIMMTTAKVHGLLPTYHASFAFTDTWLDA
ncbi:MAG: ABC transporter substrate-binding protein [Chloroflexi bacterium]|nr:ABC transporter substrate-binding protein [Chloroflexota bacterium]